jgi:purine nucleosidase
MKKILLDCDPGIDDALAILLAVNSKEIKIVGISCTHGNNSVEQTTLNTLRLLDYLNLDIPVAKGAEKPLVCEPVDYKRAVKVHGTDGLGD